MKRSLPGSSAPPLTCPTPTPPCRTLWPGELAEASHHEATLPASSWVNYQPLQPPSHPCPSGFEQGRVIQEQTLVPFLGTMNSEAILDRVPGCVNHNLGKAKKKGITEIISFLIGATLPKFSLPFPQYFCLWLLPRSLQFPRDPGTSPLIYLWCGSTLQ